MGLLQKLSDSALSVETTEKKEPVQDKPVVIKKSNSVGLLKKSLLAGDNRRLDFFEFTGKYNLEIAALLKSENETLKITNCIGLDGESVCLSVSTADFWNGIITEPEKLYTFNNSQEILPFLQFFSDKLKSSIKSLQIVRTKENSVLIICNKTIEQTAGFIADVNAIQNTETSFNSKDDFFDASQYNKEFHIDFSEALESFIVSNSKNKVQFTKVIVQLLFHNLCINFPAPEKLIYSENGKFTFYLKEDIPLELLNNHLRIECSSILGNHSELISISESFNNFEAAQ